MRKLSTLLTAALLVITLIPAGAAFDETGPEERDETAEIPVLREEPDGPVLLDSPVAVTDENPAENRDIYSIDLNFPRQVILLPVGGEADQAMIPSWVTAYCYDYSIVYSPCGCCMEGHEAENCDCCSCDPCDCPKYGSVSMEIHDIKWDYGSFDSDIPGRQQVFGTVVLPEGYTSTVDLTVKREYLVYDETPGVEPLVGAHTMLNENNTVPLGATEDELTAYMDTNALGWGEYTLDWGMEEHEAFYFYYPVSWDFRAIDTGEAGTYRPFTPLPRYFTLSDLAWQKNVIHVIDPDEVNLRNL